MAEVIKHALGLCGEHFHPNIWTLLTRGVWNINYIFVCSIIYKM